MTKLRKTTIFSITVTSLFCQKAPLFLYFDVLGVIAAAFLVFKNGPRKAAVLVSTLFVLLSAAVFCFCTFDSAADCEVFNAATEDSSSGWTQLLLSVKVQRNRLSEGRLWHSIALGKRVMSILCLCRGCGYSWEWGNTGVSPYFRSLHKHCWSGARH